MSTLINSKVQAYIKHFQIVTCKCNISLLTYSIANSLTKSHQKFFCSFSGGKKSN